MDRVLKFDRLGNVSHSHVSRWTLAVVCVSRDRLIGSISKTVDVEGRSNREKSQTVGG